MIGVKEAINAAMQAVQKYYEDQEISDLALEEVESDKSHNKWLITLGFLVPDKSPRQTAFDLEQVIGLKKVIRKYKIFAIDALTGKVISMKIRKL